LDQKIIGDENFSLVNFGTAEDVLAPQAGALLQTLWLFDFRVAED